MRRRPRLHLLHRSDVCSVVSLTPAQLQPPCSSLLRRLSALGEPRPQKSFQRRCEQTCVDSGRAFYLPPRPARRAEPPAAASSVGNYFHANVVAKQQQQTRGGVCVFGEKSRRVVLPLEGNQL